MLDIQKGLNENDLYNVFMQIEIYSILNNVSIQNIIFDLDALEYILLLKLTNWDILKNYNGFCYYNGAEIEYYLNNI